MNTARVPPFLAALGLDLSADARAVRRAYAQRLKQIDQAADAAGFQALRTAYETALSWVERRAAQPPAQEAPVVEEEEEVHAPEPAPRRSVDSGPVTDPQQLGNQAFERFIATGLATDEPALRESLQRQLADPGLINIEAQTWFEWRIANLLLGGWQPGHEVLFVAAYRCFGWEEDQRRLTLFGQAGAVLDAAIREMLIFHRQGPQHTNPQKQLIQQLRTEYIPSEKGLARDGPRLQALMQRYPHWLRIIAPLAQYQRWMTGYEALPEALRQKAPPVPLGPKDGTSSTQGRRSPGSFLWFWLFLVLSLSGALSKCSSNHREPPNRSMYQMPAAVQQPGPLDTKQILPSLNGDNREPFAWTNGTPDFGGSPRGLNAPPRDLYGLPQPMGLDKPKRIETRVPPKPQARTVPEQPPPQQRVIAVKQDTSLTPGEPGASAPER